MTEALRLENISKNFGGVDVIQDVSFAIDAGSCTALIGPNGAGKTTIFNLLSGVYAPTTGKVWLEGQQIDHLPTRARIRLGMARSFQNIRLMPHLSIVENVMLGQQSRAGGFGSMITPLMRSRWKREALDLLASLNLSIDPSDDVSTLPYGIRKKVEVVRALAAGPRLLLLDEPAAGLNPSETASLVEFLKGISATGVTLLVVEHDMSLVRSLCDRAIVLNFGRKIYDGPTAGVQEDPQVLEAYLGPSRAARAGLPPAAA